MSFKDDVTALLLGVPFSQYPSTPKNVIIQNNCLRPRTSYPLLRGGGIVDPERRERGNSSQIPT
jgi:hypothetical protein